MTDSETWFDMHRQSQMVIYGPVTIGTELLMDLQFTTGHPEAPGWLGQLSV